MHDHDRITGLWFKREIDGRKLYFDLTFNHQLWFAASGVDIRNRQAALQIRTFMDSLKDLMHIHDNGLIVHQIFPMKTPFQIGTSVLRKLLLKRPSAKKKMLRQEKLYHSFNCYALALLKQKFPKHSFWKSAKFRKVQALLVDDSYMEEMIADKETYWTRFPGLNASFAIDELLGEKEEKRSRKWLQEEVDYHYDRATGMFDKNCADKELMSAKLAEAVHMKDHDLR
jgi:hypothetical protein